MEAKQFAFTSEELNQIQKLCEASKSTDVNWVKAVSIYPAQTDGEKHWKERMLAGIRLVVEMGDFPFDI